MISCRSATLRDTFGNTRIPLIRHLKKYSAVLTFNYDISQTHPIHSLHYLKELSLTILLSVEPHVIKKFAQITEKKPRVNNNLLELN